MAEKPRVFVTRSLPGGALERLAERTDCRIWEGIGSPPPEALAAELRHADGILCLLTDRVGAADIAAAPRLRAISTCSVGLDHIDLQAATARGIRVGFTPGVLAETTADLAFGLLLSAARRIAEADRFVRAGHWTPQRRWEPDMLLGRDVHGATLGVVGLGAIGRAVARRASGFGMRILGWSRSGRRVRGVELAGLETLLSNSDFISIHVAYAKETHGLLGAAELARVKPGVVLVNTARGGVLDENALAAALADGRLFAAALDVYADEPLPPGSPLLAFENLILTPHIGSASVATRSRMADLAVDNLLAGLAGQPLPHCANPEGDAD